MLIERIKVSTDEWEFAATLLWMLSPFIGVFIVALILMAIMERRAWSKLWEE